MPGIVLLQILPLLAGILMGQLTMLMMLLTQVTTLMRLLAQMTFFDTIYGNGDVNNNGNTTTITENKSDDSRDPPSLFRAQG